MLTGKGRYELLIDQPQKSQQKEQNFSFWIEGVNIANNKVYNFFFLLKNRYRVISNFYFDEEMSIIGLFVNPCGREFEY